MRPIQWCVGVTTVLSRRETTLPKTLQCLEKGGFRDVTLFVDGCSNYDVEKYLGYSSVFRGKSAGVAGNWILAMTEMYIRNPTAHRYAIFQDDGLCYRNLKQYLNECQYPEDGYWNLYSFPENEKVLEKNGISKGWGLSNQKGKSALGLVFSRSMVVELLSNKKFVERHQDVQRGKVSIDGGILNAMQSMGYQEYCHFPTLMMHIGTISTLNHPQYPVPTSWKGEDFNALDLR